MTADPVDRPLGVVQVTKLARGGGGAERVAMSLHRGLLDRGHRSWMATTTRDRADPTLLTIPRRRKRRGNLASRTLRRAGRFAGRHARPRELGRSIEQALTTAAAPGPFIADLRGREPFDFPGTSRIPSLPPEPPDLVHLHNLHGRYFDLRQLAPMSHRLPVVMTLHDEWTFTGHCAYALHGDRWRTGCGSCPDLDVYPAIRRDGTRANLRAKADIYARSRLHVSTPSQWLMDRARDSVLARGVVDWRVIHNGVDRTIFRPGDQLEARARLGIPAEPFVLLFTAHQARRSPFKDWETVSDAAERVAAAVDGRPVLCLALGDEGPTPKPPERRAPVRPVPDGPRRGRVVLPCSRRLPPRREGRELPDHDPRGDGDRPAGGGDRGRRDPRAGPQPRRRARRAGAGRRRARMMRPACSWRRATRRAWARRPPRSCATTTRGGGSG